MPAAPITLPRPAAHAARLRPGAVRALAPFVAILIALAIGAAFIVAIGEDPLAIYALMLRQSLGTGYGIGQTLFRATPLVFTGLAVAIRLRAPRGARCRACSRPASGPTR